MNAIEKAKETFEKWLRSYCFQAPPDRDYQLMKDAFMEGAGFVALEAEKPAEDATIRISQIKHILANLIPFVDDDFKEGYAKAIADITKELSFFEKNETAPKCSTFRCYIASSDCYGCVLRKDCFPNEPQVQSFAEAYHAEKCAECIGGLPAFPHHIDHGSEHGYEADE